MARHAASSLPVPYPPLPPWPRISSLLCTLPPLTPLLVPPASQFTYQVSAIAATAGITSVGAIATYYRFWWHMADGSDFPVTEFACTLLLIAGGVVGMEMYARWAHRVLWHENKLGWSLHKSHHRPRLVP